MPRIAAASAGASGDRERPEELLKCRQGGVVFTTIQKFLPDEKGGEIQRFPTGATSSSLPTRRTAANTTSSTALPGYMRDALPNASFIGFTGTPIEKADANTRAVFGDYISVYDIQRAVEDKATVPIYYESRLAKLELNEKEKPKIDPEFEEVTEGEEDERQGEAARRNGRSWKRSSATEKRIGQRGRGFGRPLRESALRRWTARRWSSA